MYRKFRDRPVILLRPQNLDHFSHLKTLNRSCPQKIQDKENQLVYIQSLLGILEATHQQKLAINDHTIQLINYQILYSIIYQP